MDAVPSAGCNVAQGVTNLPNTRPNGSLLLDLWPHNSIFAAPGRVMPHMRARCCADAWASNQIKFESQCCDVVRDVTFLMHLSP